MLQESAALVLLLSNLPYKKAPRLTEYISWQDVQEKS